MCDVPLLCCLWQEALKLSGGCVNVLVNNAGVYYPMSLDEGPNKGQGPLDGEILFLFWGNPSVLHALNCAPLQHHHHTSITK